MFVSRPRVLCSLLLRSSLLGAILLLAACGQTLEPPPLDIAHRDSLLGAGRILQITNTGSETITCPQVRIETPAGDIKNHNLGALASGERVELGWKKLGGFEITRGAEVTFECEGYFRPLAVTLDTPASQ